jgi:selenocysteine lyase/cysteine desulfurase
MSVDWEKIRREEYPTIEKQNFTYFLSAGASLMNKSSYRQGIDYFTHMHSKGDIGHELLFAELEQIRKQIADYINADPHEIAFLINTSSGFAVAAYMFRKRLGGVLYPSYEFPTSIHMFKRLKYPCIKVSDINGAYPLEIFQENYLDDVSFSIQSHVQSFNGFRQNLTEFGRFCKKKEIINIINPTQSFGAFPIDVKKDNIDIITTNALKWMGCGYGIGILFIKDDIVHEYGLPFTAWLSVENPFVMDNENLNLIQKTQSMDSFGGCPNFASLLTLKGAFDLIKTKIGGGDIHQGIKRIKNRILNLTSQFFEVIHEFNLKSITPEDIKWRSGIITLEHNDAKKLHRYLTKNNIFTTLKQYPKASKKTLIRFAINYYNNSDDINRVAEVLKSCKYLN